MSDATGAETAAATPAVGHVDPRHRTVACAQCGTKMLPYLVSYVNAQAMCSGCAGEALKRSKAPKYAVIAGVAAVALLVVGLTGYFALRGFTGARGEIGRSLHAMRSLYLAQRADEAEAYIDTTALTNDLVAGSAAAGDPQPEAAAGWIWNAVVRKGIQGGSVEDVDGDVATVTNTVKAGTAHAEYTLRYEMRRQGPDRWKITRILNADELYATYAAKQAPAQ